MTRILLALPLLLSLVACAEEEIVLLEGGCCEDACGALDWEEDGEDGWGQEEEEDVLCEEPEEEPEDCEGEEDEGELDEEECEDRGADGECPDEDCEALEEAFEDCLSSGLPQGCEALLRELEASCWS